MTTIAMPLTSTEALASFLEAGWTCFQHGKNWWITRRFAHDRVMMRVPDWQVAHLKRTNRVVQNGVVLSPTFNFSHRRTA